MVIKAGGYADAGEFAIHDWTPVFNAADLGSGATNDGWYTNRNGLVTAHLYVVFGTTPSFASTIYVDLPVAADVGGIQACVGSWVFRDQSTVKHHAGSMGIWNSAGTQSAFGGCYDSGTGISDSRIANGKPFTVAAGDYLSAALTYRAAA
jgi:hypothetical protein